MRHLEQHAPISRTSVAGRPPARSLAPSHNSHRQNRVVSKQGPFHFQTDARQCLRECCRVKKNIERQLSAQKLQKKKQFEDKKGRVWLDGRSKHHRSVDAILRAERSRERPSYKVSRFVGMTPEEMRRHKRKVYILPQLKSFHEDVLDQPEDRQTQHKTYKQQQSRLGTEDATKIQKLPSIYHQNRRELEETARVANYSYIDELSMVRDRSDSKFDERTSLSGPYYKYIENYPKPKAKELTKKHNRLLSQASLEEPQLSDSRHQLRDGPTRPTIFHSHKLKLKLSAAKANRRAHQQEKEIHIPKTEEELSQYLISYQPMQPGFNVKTLVKRQDFQIVAKQDEVYFGQVSEGSRQGEGILLTKKEIFEGVFSQDSKKAGVQRNIVGTYTGHFREGRRHGFGKFQWNSGECYEGEWIKGQKKGHGVWTSSKGSKYEGQWKHNKQNGRGTFLHAGGSTYTGYFKDFLKHGRGEEDFSNGDKYVGQYKQGKPHGYGKYQWANGDVYEGDFVEGSRSGTGKLKHPNGDSYEGGFREDVKEGSGKERYGASGQWFEGQFERGQIVKGKYYSRKGILLRELS